MPDLFVPIDTTAFTPYYRNLVAKGILNRFCITYVDRNRSRLNREYPDVDAFIAKFSVDSAMMDDIVKLGVADSVKLDPAQLERSRPMIETIVKGVIARDLFDTSAYFRVVNPQLSPVYREALGLINDERRYNKLLREGREFGK